MELTHILEQVRQASRALNLVEQQVIDDILWEVAQEIENNTDYIIAENQKDVMRMPQDNPMYDRLLLNATRIKTIAEDMRNVSKLSSPICEIMNETIRPNGMKIQKVRVPFGVIGVIYESRPNVSCDVFALCFKTKNACILKGGKEADYSNRALVEIIAKVLSKKGIDIYSVQLLPADREATMQLLQAEKLVDLIIPRGSASLIQFVRQHSRIPTIETGAGICHVYIDKSGDVEKGKQIVFNSKTRRVSVCNAMDTLIVHRERLGDLSAICKPLIAKNVVICADERAYHILENHYPKDLLQATDEQSFGTEFLDYKMSIKTVDNISEAIGHITKYSSKHSEAIVAEDMATIEVFLCSIDAACVYANVSTAFTDGAEFGFGAEIGISTQKLHARGPMALPELTTYKYIITGSGQIRG